MRQKVTDCVVEAHAERAAVRASAEQHVAAVREMSETVAHVYSSQVFGGCPCECSGRDCRHLFDPQTMGEMYERAEAVMHYLHTAHDLEYEDRCWCGTGLTAKPYDPEDQTAQGKLFLFMPREPRKVRVFADTTCLAEFLQVKVECPDLGHCDLQLATGCPGTTGGVFVPIQRGQFLVLFDICEFCMAYVNTRQRNAYDRSDTDAYREYHKARR